MDEKMIPNNTNWLSAFANMKSSDKAYTGLAVTLGACYVAKLFFDSVDTAMERDYDAELSVKPESCVRFKKSSGYEENTLSEPDELTNAFSSENPEIVTS